MALRDKIEALHDHICERFDSTSIAEAIFFGRKGLVDMSEEELQETAQFWDFPLEEEPDEA